MATHERLVGGVLRAAGRTESRRRLWRERARLGLFQVVRPGGAHLRVRGAADAVVEPRRGQRASECTRLRCTTMSAQVMAQLRSALERALAPTSLEIIDDSAAHAGHPGSRSGGHYRVTLVSE